MKELLTTKEMEKVLKVSRFTINEYRKKGMPYICLGRAIRFDLEEVMEWARDKNK